MKSIVTGWPEQPAERASSSGPNGLRQEEVEELPTITGLMKSGITNSTIRTRRPRNGRSIASASNKPSTQLDGDA